MRCPKCGSFVEDGRNVCFMCGENFANGAPQQGNFDNVNNQQGQSNDIINSTLAESLNSSIGGNVVQSNNSYSGFNNNPQMPQQAPDNGFGTGGFSGSPGGFSTGTQPTAPMEQHTTFSAAPAGNPNDYKNAEVKILKNEEEDIFDFYAKHKGPIKVILAVLVIALVGVIGYNVYLGKVTPEELKPKFHDLYFEVGDEFDQTKEGTESVTFAKSGSKGTDCFIEINIGSGSSGDHVEEFQKLKITELTPERDDEGNAKDPLKEFTTQTNEMKLNDHTWHYMNIFYRKSVTSEYTLLKYQLLTAVKNGYYYDIVLTNNSSTNSCGVELDNFLKSLQFVDKEK